MEGVEYKYVGCVTCTAELIDAISLCSQVRWQHEDDVSACQNCKSSLSANRRKHHCRHCGRIFCSDCVTKTVASGPTGRPDLGCK